jgi:Putative Ig domain/Kelch motif
MSAADTVIAALTAQFGHPVRTLADLARGELNAYDSTPTITTASLPSVNMGGTYNQTLATTGGLAPLTFSIVAGALPATLDLNPATGAITGTVTSSSGTFSFTVQVSSVNGRASSQPLSIAVLAGKLYLIGGSAGGVATQSRVDVFDLGTRTWASDVTALGFTKCVTGDGGGNVVFTDAGLSIVLGGGSTNSGSGLNRISYRSPTGTWTESNVPNINPNDACGVSLTFKNRVLCGVRGGNQGYVLHLPNTWDLASSATGGATNIEPGQVLIPLSAASGAFTNYNFGGAYFYDNGYFYGYLDDDGTPEGTWNNQHGGIWAAITHSSTWAALLADGSILLLPTNVATTAVYRVAADLSAVYVDTAFPNSSWLNANPTRTCLLPDGRVFVVNNSATAQITTPAGYLFTPGGSVNTPGSWAATNGFLHGWGLGTQPMYSPSLQKVYFMAKDGGNAYLCEWDPAHDVVGFVPTIDLSSVGGAGNRIAAFLAVIG